MGEPSPGRVSDDGPGSSAVGPGRGPSAHGAQDNRQATRSLAQHYAAELSAQLGTLSYFTRHSGEIGRVHEFFLRQVIERFLPGHFRLGTGFIAMSAWTSRQCDLLIYDTSWPLLFQAGDVVVCDIQMSEGVIESKTTLDSRELRSSLDALAEIELKRNLGRYPEDQFRAGEVFRAVYASDGVSAETAVDCLVKWVEQQRVAGHWKSPDSGSRRAAPHAIYVRGKYLLLRNEDDLRVPAEQQPMKDVAYKLVMLDRASDVEGEALLAFVAKFWEIVSPMGNTDVHRPPWLRMVNLPLLEDAQHVKWPAGT